MSHSTIHIYTHASDKKALESMAMKLLTERLVACVHITGPMTSHYVWKGEIEHAKEYMLMAKTKRILGKKVVRRIEQLHPYDCPVIEIVQVASVNSLAARWMLDVLKS